MPACRPPDPEARDPDCVVWPQTIKRYGTTRSASPQSLVARRGALILRCRPNSGDRRHWSAPVRSIGSRRGRSSGALCPLRMHPTFCCTGSVISSVGRPQFFRAEALLDVPRWPPSIRIGLRAPSKDVRPGLCPGRLHRRPCLMRAAVAFTAASRARLLAFRRGPRPRSR